MSKSFLSFDVMIFVLILVILGKGHLNSLLVKLKYLLNFHKSLKKYKRWLKYWITCDLIST